MQKVKEKEHRARSGFLVPEWDSVLPATENLKTLTLIVAGHPLVQKELLRFFAAVVELQGVLRRPTSGVCDCTAGEFHELGRIANEYQRTPGFTAARRRASGLQRK
jgi:hypothetical protein